MMENNSFDRMLGALLPDRSGQGGGIQGATGRYSNTDNTTGAVYALKPTQAREVQDDPGHELGDTLEQIVGPCKNFVNNFVKNYPSSSSADRQEIMSYYPDGSLPALHKLAKTFTICDRWFSSMPGPTWPNRCFVHTGTSLGFTDMKWLHYWDQTTLYQLLSAQGISWKIYYGDIPSTYILVNKPDPSQCYSLRYFYQDIAGPERSFPQYVFIDPAYFGKNPSDQHPPHDVLRGEALISDVYNALRSNDELWQRSLLVVTYDEHGGLFDHVYPASTIAPDNRRDGSGFDFALFGVRVPTVLVSPWLDHGVITDTFDHTSLLKFLIDKWGLNDALGARASWAGTNTFKKYLRRAPRNTDRALPRIEGPRFLPARVQTELTDHQRALCDMAELLASEVKDLSIRIPLQRRSLDRTPAAEAQLAMDRFEAYLLDRAKLRPAERSNAKRSRSRRGGVRRRK